MTINTDGCVGSSIYLGSGRFFDFDKFQDSPILIEDIARSLGNTCRYNGHCDYYSVAEHSIHCYLAAQKYFPGMNEFAFECLMHDAAEAYLGDATKPLKIRDEFAGYRDLEQRIETHIWNKFDIDAWSYPNIKLIDMAILKAEKRHLFPEAGEWQGLEKYPDYEVDFEMLQPKEAGVAFLSRYRQAHTQRGIVNGI